MIFTPTEGSYSYHTIRVTDIDRAETYVLISDTTAQTCFSIAKLQVSHDHHHSASNNSYWYTHLLVISYHESKNTRNGLNILSTPAVRSTNDLLLLRHISEAVPTILLKLASSLAVGTPQVIETGELLRRGALHFFSFYFLREATTFRPRQRMNQAAGGGNVWPIHSQVLHCTKSTAEHTAKSLQQTTTASTTAAPRM